MPKQTEQTDAGEQFLIDGVAPVNPADKLKLKAAAPLAAAVPQKPCNAGLFDDGARDQLDLVELAKQITCRINAAP